MYVYVSRPGHLHQNNTHCVSIWWKQSVYMYVIKVGVTFKTGHCFHISAEMESPPPPPPPVNPGYTPAFHRLSQCKCTRALGGYRVGSLWSHP